MGAAKTTLDKKPKKDDSMARMQAVQKRLKASLTDLERQYQELAGSIENSRQTSQEFQEEGQRIQARMKRLHNRLSKFGDYAGRQQRFLNKLRKFQYRNERLLEMIAHKLQSMENQQTEIVSKEVAEEAGDSTQLRQDLLLMLGELDEMRRRREELLQKIKENQV